ncbi:MAG: alpha/beta hydrolase [Cyanobacteria bacterium P01_H01_bin.15]
MWTVKDIDEQWIQVSGDVRIKVRATGKGPPLLLLHGYPQTSAMWHRLVPELAKDFRVVATDLRGYGDSSKPPGSPDHSNYSKRSLALDQIQVMAQLGFDQFYLVGHDRGARVAHRLTVDHPHQVKRLVLLDIVPTYDMYQRTDQAFAQAYYHWFFLTQPSPLPETLIGAEPDFYLETCLKNWSRNDDPFSTEALAEYRRCFGDSETIHGTCEDYRAAASIDLEHDHQDRAAKITCPLLVLWGARGFVGQQYDVLKMWGERATNVRGHGLDCGHFLPEEAPEQTYQAVYSFFSQCCLERSDLTTVV